MALKLHTCGLTAFHGPHPCWKVMKALDEASIPYEQVKHPSFPKSRRNELDKLSGQRVLPVVEFEDGRTLREESAQLVTRIQEGRLQEGEPAAGSA
ncbi:MAG: hypothetical protein QOK31_1196 [Solirubrobacteraceae bacterium]|jgi:glutathione S-transferase|nr:hypothetical protein [Solirubrobacteraceae bacterium]